MSVRDFIELFNDLYAARIRLFDCNSGEIIFDSDEEEFENLDPVEALFSTGMYDDEVLSVDLYRDDKTIVLELNVEHEEE